MTFGSMPNDGGNLIFTEDEYYDFISNEKGSEEYFREYIGSEELINRKKRFCLWLVDAEPSKLRNLPKILERIEKTKNNRLASRRDATKKLANTPALFAEIRQPQKNYLFFPLISSENRTIIPIGFMGKEVIINNKGAFVISDNLLYIFGMLSSSIHMVWINKVCGRLKSDYNYSISTVYNNFPWPENPTDEQKMEVEECAQAVLDARLQFPNSSLADLYDPNTMPPELVKAHTNLDRAVDICYGKKFQDKEERIEFLFNLYKKYTENK